MMISHAIFLKKCCSRTFFLATGLIPLVGDTLNDLSSPINTLVWYEATPKAGRMSPSGMIFAYNDLVDQSQKKISRGKWARQKGGRD